MKVIDIANALKDPYSSVETLEQFIREANKANTVADGTQRYPDDLYDQAFDLLKTIKPDSEVLLELWDQTDEGLQDKYTMLLARNPMKSITTIKDITSATFKNYIKTIRVAGYETADFIANVKLNGHGIRLVYEKGEFVNATSRARRGAGNDLTVQMRVVLKEKGLLHIPYTQDIVEIRGEVLLPLDKLAEARQFNPKIVSAFTGVSSLLKASGTEEQWCLLDFVAYRVFTSDERGYDTRSQEFQTLEELGFSIPAYWVLNDVKVSALESVATRVVEDISLELADTNYPYYLDGIVLEIDNTVMFKSLGGNVKYDQGNVALKVGAWAQQGYHGYIQYVIYKTGSVKMSPVAIVATQPGKAEFQYEEGAPVYTDYNAFVKDYGQQVISVMDKYVLNYKQLGVLTASGNVVKAVPLYEIANIVKYGLQVGSPITFNYGGEAGVTTVFDGQAVAYFNIG